MARMEKSGLANTEGGPVQKVDLRDQPLHIKGRLPEPDRRLRQLKSRRKQGKPNSGGMTKDQLGRHNADALGSLLTNLAGEPKRKKEQLDSRRSNSPLGRANETITSNSGDLQNDPADRMLNLERKEKLALLAANTDSPDEAERASRALVDDAAIDAELDRADPETIEEASSLVENEPAIDAIKNKKKGTLSDSEKLALALFPAVTVLAGAALGGRTGALIGAKATFDGLRVFADMTSKEKQNALKLKSKGKLSSGKIKSFKRDGKLYFGVIDTETGTIKEVVDSKGNPAESAEVDFFTKMQMTQRGKQDELAIKEKLRGESTLQKEEVRTEREIQREERRDIRESKREERRDIRGDKKQAARDKEFNRTLALREKELNARLKRADQVAARAEKKAKAKGATASQFKAAGFAARIEQAEGNFASLDKIGFKRQDWMTGLKSMGPDVFKSENLKLQEQAERNFINAVLRRESGAAISPTEFDSAEKQYFPRAGDTKAVVNQKRQSRKIVLDNIRRESGAAFVSPGAAPEKTEKNAVGTTLKLKKRMKNKKVGDTLPIGKQQWKIESSDDSGITIKRVK